MGKGRQQAGSQIQGNTRAKKARARQGNKARWGKGHAYKARQIQNPRQVRHKGMQGKAGVRQGIIQIKRAKGKDKIQGHKMYNKVRGKASSSKWQG